MKYICSFLLFILAGSCANAMSKHLSPPFLNVPLSNINYSSITVDYELLYPSQILVCNLTNAYKVYMQYPLNGIQKTTGTFGNAHTVIFSNIAKDSDIGKYFTRYQADKKGSIEIFDIPQPQRLFNTHVSCGYAIS